MNQRYSAKLRLVTSTRVSKCLFPHRFGHILKQIETNHRAVLFALPQSQSSGLKFLDAICQRD